MTTAMPVRWQIGFDTDLGGGKENQDDCFIWSSPDDGICVIGVLDGHGREVGKVAANAAKSSLKEFFKMHFSELRTSPHDCLIRAHEVAHLAIKSKFRALYEDDGYEIMENSEGYLLKSMKGQQWSCIHGGSTCSICALVDGYLYTANVGDSTGILCSTHPVLTKADVSVTGDGAVSTEIRKKYTDSIIIDDSDHKDNCTSIIITAEHSPESPYEFLRLRDFRAKVDKPDLPALNVVYDSPAHEKAKCPQVFSIGEGRQPILTNKGCYYKNVRKEWASLVSTPATARFQDALAFTRSLGDLHLHTFGVTHLPEVRCVNLIPLLNTLQSECPCYSGSSLTSGSTDSPDSESELVDKKTFPLLCLVLATDGVWDNWTYSDLTKFVVDQSCLHAVTMGPDGAHRVALSLMQKNAVLSKKNFGSQADNATCVILFLSQSESFPADTGCEEAK